MTLSFSQHLNGKPTYFPEKIISGFPDGSNHNNMFVWCELNIANAPRGEGVGIVACGPMAEYVPKLHTIREDKADRWKPGIDIHMVIHNRTPNRYQFVPVMECTAVQVIEMVPTPWDLCVYIGDRLLNPAEMEKLARNDGFDSLDDFNEYFREDFTGKIIHWTDLRS